MNNTLNMKITKTSRKFAMFFFTMLASAHAYSASYSEGWEDRSFVKPSLGLGGGCYYKPKQSYNSFEISNKYKREGNYSLRIELHGDDKNSICPNESSRKEKKSRSEINFAWNHPDFKQIQHGQEIWWGTSYYFPSNEGTFTSWSQASLPRINIAQFMGKGNSFTPELFVVLGNGGKIDFQSKYSTAAGGEKLVTNQDSAVVKPDRWNDIVVNWKRSWQSDGFIRIWVNGVLVMNRSGPSAIRDKPFASISQGAYLGTEIIKQDYVWYIDGTKIGDETSSFEDVSPGSKGVGAVALPLPPNSVTVK